jgi:hypothetical protein
MPALVSSCDVADLRREDARQTVVVGCGEFLELLPRRACRERAGLGTPQFHRLALAQSLDPRRIDARLRQPLANNRANRKPSPLPRAIEGVG